jgi:16S rRNA (adenine1518-N6/adenine1519-N6)-dimethyltransferase
VPHARKQFGQHWLRSEKALNKILAAAELVKGNGDTIKGDRVLEIGPGKGVLTRSLLAAAEAVVAVEIDRDLCDLLAKKLGNADHFLLLQGDFLSLELETLLANFPTFQHPNKVVANIPYNITGAILEKLLGTISQPNPRPFESIVLLVQKEVAQRLYAKPGSKQFGALSVRVQYLANCQFICDVPAIAFQPQPKVDSVVIRLCPHAIENPPDDPHSMETLIKLGFSSKRKMLRNNLKSLVTSEQLSRGLEQLNINPQARAEDLSVEKWVALSNFLGTHKQMDGNSAGEER